MKKKYFKERFLWIIIIIALMIVAILFFIYYNVKKIPENYYEESLGKRFYIEEKEITAEDIHILKRESGVTSENNQFSPGDYVELKGIFELGKEAKIYFNLLDKEKKIIKEEFLPSLNYYEVIHYYGTEEEISRCCGYVFMEEGEYYIGIFIDNEILKEIPFKIIK